MMNKMRASISAAVLAALVISMAGTASAQVATSQHSATSFDDADLQDRSAPHPPVPRRLPRIHPQPQAAPSGAAAPSGPAASGMPPAGARGGAGPAPAPGPGVAGTAPTAAPGAPGTAPSPGLGGVGAEMMPGSPQFPAGPPGAGGGPGAAPSFGTGGAPGMGPEAAFAAPGAPGGAAPSAEGGAGGPTAGVGGGALEAGLGGVLGAQPSAMNMIGDLGPGLRLLPTSSISASATVPRPFPPPLPPRPPSPAKASALVPSVRGLKIAENQSPQPQDRLFFTFDYFANVNGPLNQRLNAPVSDIRVYRYIFGLEKTCAGGNASIGIRLPLDQLTSNPRVPARFKQFGGTSTALDDLNLFGKFILRQDPSTGSLISVGLAITPTTGGGRFAGAPYIQYINTTLFQPFVGYLWNRGNFYLHGFSAMEFPVNPSQVTEMFNDIGVGYFLLRSNDPDRFLTAVAPTFEVHVSSPLNHHGFDNPREVAGTPSVVNLTYGVNFEFARNTLLTLGFVNPVTGPRPFDYEAVALLNIRFGRSARRANPPVISD